MKIRAFSALMLTTTAAYADVPNVVTDIPAVHSLVSQVMGDLGSPKILMKQGSSPHGYSMRPSEARALQEADMVVWIGEDLTPWLESSIENLAPEAESLELLHAHGTKVLNFRETPIFAGEDHHDDHDDHDEHKDEHHDDHDDHEEHADEGHGHDDHKDEHHDDHDDHDDHKDEHGHDDHDEEGHDEHAEEGHHDEHGHDHDGADPHAWLSPHNAASWVGEIAEHLSELDPENAATYEANAAAAAEGLEALEGALAAQLAPYSGAKFIVFHDAYQYFEEATGLKATGALQVSDATPPSAARLTEIQAEIQEHNITCVFSEPQFSDALVKSVTNGQVSATVIDPLGVGLDLGAGLYTELLQNIADSIEGCIK
ncbi:zinc ABC transporter substrate-binding protein [Cognatishimia activa]|uniref:High-affinity zinc uptake system protein ZnuA n=1 Tax=Cognatishimia activa TaxID=1715691 RepID=A0A975ERU9_9RHOB|nr:zinc ABC transporter substrate-binding protein [Cognatishimia activa]QTN37247.1 zinc ABC transporter substrate-binding protein [Cognatishimia activa]